MEESWVRGAQGTREEQCQQMARLSSRRVGLMADASCTPRQGCSVPGATARTAHRPESGWMSVGEDAQAQQ